MVIQWHGKSCFTLVTKGARHTEDVTVVVDPYHPESGMKLPRTLAGDLLLMTHDHPSHNYREGVGGTPFVIDGPGEYEVKGIFVYGIPTAHDEKSGSEHGPNTMYRIEAEEMSIAHVGDLGHTLTDAQLEALKDIDILCVPVGGGSTIDAAKAAEVVQAIEPRIVIPMHYTLPGRAPEDVQKFLKAMGIAAPEKTDKLKITRKDLPEDQLRVVVFENA